MYFDYFMMSVITLNTVVMCVPHYEQEQWVTNMDETTDRLFLAIYIVEFGIKMIGLGPIGYLGKRNPNQAANILDVSVVMAGTFGFIAEVAKINLGDVLGFFNVLRVLRVMRIFRLARKQKDLQAMLTTIVKGVRPVLSVTLLTFFHVYVFASMGTAFFKNTPLWRCERMDSNFNFDNPLHAMLVMFSIVSGVSFKDYLDDIAIDPPACVEASSVTELKDSELTDCGPWYTTSFFYIFALVTHFVILPLFVATVVQEFMEANSNEDGYLTKIDIPIYSSTWIKFEEIETDASGKPSDRDGRIPIWKLRPLIEALDTAGSSLGFPVSSNQLRWKAVNDDLAALGLPYGNEVPFYPTFYILLIRSVEPQPLSAQEYNARDAAIDDMIRIIRGAAKQQAFRT